MATNSRYCELLRVHQTGAKPHRGVLVSRAFTVPCALGRAGIKRIKREGDGASPAGVFSLRRLYFRADQGYRPICGLDTEAIGPDLGWCDDPASARYNTPVRLPAACGHERMWRDDHLYDLVIVIGHNDNPPLKPRGSAIFLHLARAGFAPTEGCIALERDHMRRLLPQIGPDTRIVLS